MRKDSYRFNPFGGNKDLQLFTAVLVFAGFVAITGSIAFVQRQSGGNVLSARQTVIHVTANGFVPATVSVKAGTQVVWKNTDSAPHAVASNPYPQNSSVPGLKSQTMLPGGSYTYKSTASGTIEYHDDTQPTLSGTIQVEQ